MTDKHIIIDGCDVSGCEYIIPPHEQCPNKPMPYAKETSCFACKEHNTKLNFCKHNPNCYYKQLKRKEQECEGLKYELILKDVANIELSDEVKKYRKAIDEIEEIADNNYEIAEMGQIFLIIGGLDV